MAHAPGQHGEAASTLSRAASHGLCTMNECQHPIDCALQLNRLHMGGHLGHTETIPCSRPQCMCHR